MPWKPVNNAIRQALVYRLLQARNISGHDACCENVGGCDGEEEEAGHGDELVVLEGSVCDKDPASVHDVVQGCYCQE